MSDSLQNQIVESNIPAPMEMLEREIIHPDNIALERRVRAASTLKQTQVRKLKQQAKRLQQTVDLDAYLQGRDEIRAMNERLRETTICLHIVSEMDTQSLPYSVRLQYIALRCRYLHHAARCHRRRVVVYASIKDVQKEAQHLLTIQQQIQAYTIAQRHKRQEADTQATMLKEAKIFAQFIRQEWLSQPRCHITVRHGRDFKKKTARFARLDMTPVSHYFEIMGSFKGYFGYRRALPESVKLSDLVADEVLQNIQLAIKRPVRAEINTRGAWIIVDRLDTVGGLPDYIDYQHIMEFYPDFIQDAFPLCLGVTEHGRVVYLRLLDYPHFLIAGYTNSGKSNIVNVILCTLIKHHSPREIQFILIDMKGGLEFSHYRTLPHLLGDIVEETEDVADMLARLETEMIARFKRLKSRLAKKLEQYNAVVPDSEKMPRIAVFFDEMATLAQQGDLTKRIIASLLNLSSKGRAVGIHLFLCTQHPSVDILKGAIKTNLSVRLTGRMPTATSSMTVLGTGAASKLDPVPGRMVFMVSADPKPVQTPYISNQDIETILLDAKRSHLDNADYALPESKTTHQVWTPERIIELSIKHLNGNVSFNRVFDATDDLSRRQAQKLCEQIWQMKQVVYDGKTYDVKLEGRKRYLVEMA